MPQKDRKGAPKASATMKSSKAGFDTYDDQVSDSVAVVKKGSTYDSNAKKQVRKMEEMFGKDSRMKNYGASAGVKVQAELTKEDPSMKGYYKDIDIAEKRKSKSDGSFSFFKHTQKDNK